MQAVFSPALLSMNLPHGVFLSSVVTPGLKQAIGIKKNRKRAACCWLCLSISFIRPKGACPIVYRVIVHILSSFYRQSIPIWGVSISFLLSRHKYCSKLRTQSQGIKTNYKLVVFFLLKSWQTNYTLSAIESMLTGCLHLHLHFQTLQ